MTIFDETALSIDVRLLVCPRDRSELSRRLDALSCEFGHSYPIVDGIPVMLLEELPANTAITESLGIAAAGSYNAFGNESPEDVHQQVSQMISATNGLLYSHLVNNLPRYPIPELRMVAGQKSLLLDVGCNWGRWTIAASEKGYNAVGLDPHLKSLAAARLVARQRGCRCQFVCGDARAMPFRENAFDSIFSYSVIQHFSRVDARLALIEAARVLRLGGQAMVQMPNKFGIRSLYHLTRRNFRDGEAFDVRYWTPASLLKAFTEIFGDATVSVDGFFGLGIQSADIDLMPFTHRIVIRASELMRKATSVMPMLSNVADSLYITSVKNEHALVPTGS